MLSFVGLGWARKLQIKRDAHLLLIDKSIITGNGLRKGQKLYSFLVRWNNRTALLTFLDGKGVNKETQMELQTFVLKE